MVLGGHDSFHYKIYSLIKHGNYKCYTVLNALTQTLMTNVYNGKGFSLKSME